MHLIYDGRGQNTPTTPPFCSSRRPILQEILTDRSPRTMTIVQHSLVNTKRHTPWHSTTPPPQLLPAWLEKIEQSTTFHASPPARLCPPFHLGPPTGLEGICQANRGAWLRSTVTPREGAPTPLTPHQQRPRAKHSSRKPVESSKPASIRVNHQYSATSNNRPPTTGVPPPLCCTDSNLPSFAFLHRSFGRHVSFFFLV